MLRAGLGVLLSLLVLVVGCTTRVVVEKEVAAPLESFTDLRNSTVRLQVMDDGGDIAGVCSGVVVRPHVVLTAAHCDLGAKFLIAGLDAVKIRKDEERDLMLMYVERLEAPAVVSGTVAKDERVIVVGFPIDVTQVVTEGRAMGPVSQSLLDRAGDYAARMKHYVVVTAPTIYGNSGGPVFNSKHELVGIMSAVAVAGGFFPVTHVAFMVDADSIRAFLL